VTADVELLKGQGRTLVFAANVAAANKVRAIVAETGLQPLLYHREVQPQDRAAALDAMRARLPFSPSASMQMHSCMKAS